MDDFLSFAMGFGRYTVLGSLGPAASKAQIAATTRGIVVSVVIMATALSFISLFLYFLFSFLATSLLTSCR